MLIIFICSQIQSECYKPLILNEEFNSKYDCLHQGYMESQILLENIGKDQVNENGLIIKFNCKEKINQNI